MNDTVLLEKLQEVINEFSFDLQYLQENQALTQLDVKRIVAQAEVTKNALLSTKEDKSFSDSAKEKLWAALITNFELSIQKSLEDIISKKGDKALLLYKLRRVDRKLIKYAQLNSYSNSKTDTLYSDFQLLSTYIVKIWGSSNRSIFGNSTYINLLVENYQSVLQQRIDQTRQKLK
jgi:hypothetical protein